MKKFTIKEGFPNLDHNASTLIGMSSKESYKTLTGKEPERKPEKTSYGHKYEACLYPRMIGDLDFLEYLKFKFL